jgi:hypothetical protein
MINLPFQGAGFRLWKIPKALPWGMMNWAFSPIDFGFEMINLPF